MTDEQWFVLVACAAAIGYGLYAATRASREPDVPATVGWLTLVGGAGYLALHVVYSYQVWGTTWP